MLAGNLQSHIVLIMSFTFGSLKISSFMPMQIVGLCQALNDVLDGMAKKGMSIPV